MAPRYSLNVIRKNLIYRLKQFEELEVPQSMTGDYAGEAQEAWRSHRRLGIAQLLTKGDRAAFFASLERSATLRRDLLLATKGHQDEPELAGVCRQSALGPFFDALACGNLALAKEIALASQASFIRRYEYEDDFNYARCLFALLGGGAAAELRRLLRRFEESTEGEQTSRLRLSEALAKSDDAAFEAALQTLIEEHEAYFLEMKSGIMYDSDGFATEQFVMVEGLALKVLATKRKLSPGSEHRFMPSNAYFNGPNP